MDTQFVSQKHHVWRTELNVGVFSIAYIISFKYNLIKNPELTI